MTHPPRPRPPRGPSPGPGITRRNSRVSCVGSRGARAPGTQCASGLRPRVRDSGQEWGVSSRAACGEPLAGWSRGLRFSAKCPLPAQGTRWFSLRGERWPAGAEGPEKSLQLALLSALLLMLFLLENHFCTESSWATGPRAAGAVWLSAAANAGPRPLWAQAG